MANPGPHTLSTSDYQTNSSNNPRSICEILRSHAPSSSIAIIDDNSGARISYAALVLRAVQAGLRIVNTVSQTPSEEGPIIALHMHRCIDFFTILLGLLEMRKTGVVCLSRDMQDQTERNRNESVLKELSTSEDLGESGGIQLLVTDDEELVSAAGGNLSLIHI